MNKIHFSKGFLIFGISSLILAVIFGVTASLQYVFPEFLKDFLAFNQIRPLHVTCAVSWIVLSSTGGIYFYITQEEKITLSKPLLGKIHLLVFVITGLAIIASYLQGIFGGREYFSFSPIWLVPILLGWILFGYNYLSTMLCQVKNWPVYYWMWGTGICFMIFHLCEAHFWLFDYFRSDYLKDFSVKWKSYGSFVGSWNLLVYGTAIYLMSKLKRDNKTGRGKLAFFFYFLGLTNLMFGWAHHIYIVPISKWIRYLAYLVSMTEWIVLAYMLWNWKNSIQSLQEYRQNMTIKFLITSDYWVLGNIFLALLISIPAINLYTHGTHFTVAHSMGTTIGINTSILFASLSYIASKNKSFLRKNLKWFKIGHGLFNTSLVFFLAILILMGIQKMSWVNQDSGTTFSQFQESQILLFQGFAFAGFVLALSIILLALGFLKNIWN